MSRIGILSSFSVLYRREILTLWLTPAPYLSFLALLGTGGYFLSRYIASYTARLEQFKAGFLPGSETPNVLSWVVEPYFETIGFFLLFIIPVLTARTFSEEKQNGTLQLILTAPIHPASVVFAKFFALLSSMTLLLGLLSLPVGYLLFTLGISGASFFCGLIALVLTSSLYIALGCAISQTINHPIAASLVHLSSLIVLYFLHSAIDFLVIGTFSIAEFLSPVLRSTEIMHGSLSPAHIGYFVALTIGLLVYTQVHLTLERRA